MQQDKIIYTALFGNYEELKDPTVITHGWRYVCFTDQPITSTVWEIVNREVLFDDPRRTARWFKIMGWVDWKKSIWVDASFIIKCDLTQWWEQRFVSPFSAARHPLRSCVYREISYCIAVSRGEADKLIIQDKDYKNLCVPDNNGIITSGILLRENTPDCITMCEKWWADVVKYSTRDQVAFARASLGFKYHVYLWDYGSREAREQFEYVKHFKERQ